MMRREGALSLTRFIQQQVYKEIGLRTLIRNPCHTLHRKGERDITTMDLVVNVLMVMLIALTKKETISDLA